MSAAGPATAYVTGATLGEREKLAAAIRMLLTGLGLLRETVGGSGPQVQIKKSTHLYVFDDAILSGELQLGEPIEPAQMSKAESRAAQVVAGLDRLFAKPTAGLPNFMWPQLKPNFGRSAPGRTVSSGKPNHWFIGYELLMDGPYGRANGIRGAVMEFRLVPLKDDRWRLALLHIRFPLLAKPLETNLFKLPGGSGGEPDKGGKARELSNPLILPAIPTFRPLIIGARKAVPEAKGPEEIAAAIPPPPIRYVLPVEGSNLLAPYYAFAGEEGERFAPATSESAIILIDEKRPGGMILLKAAVAPSIGAPWSFTWHYAGMEKGRPNRPVEAMATGPTLLLEEGLYDVDLLVTRTVRTGRGETGGTSTIVLRTRRMVSSAHAIVEVLPEQAATIVHSHGERDTAAAPGHGPPGHHHA